MSPHENIIFFHKYLEYEGQPAILMEYAERTLLDDMRRVRGRAATQGRYTEVEVLILLGKLARALAHVHGNGPIHRDITPGNILFVHDEPKLADFSMAKHYAPADAHSNVGTEGYIPPEGTQDASPARDVWALGQCIYEMMAGRKFDAGMHAPDVTFSLGLWSLVVSMLDANRESRPTAQQVALKCLDLVRIGDSRFNERLVELQERRDETVRQVRRLARQLNEINIAERTLNQEIKDAALIYQTVPELRELNARERPPLEDAPVHILDFKPGVLPQSTARH